MDDFLEFAGILLAGIIGAAALVIVILLCLWPFQRYACHNEGHTAGYASKYQFSSDTCFMKIDGRWTPDTVWRHNTGN